MTNQIRNPNDEKVLVRFGCLIGATIACCVACWWAAGFSLGLFFGGLFIATFLLPAAVLEQPGIGRIIAGFFAIILSITGAWMLAVVKTADTIGQLLQTVIVLLCFGFVIAGVALMLRRLRMPSIFAAAVAIILGLAWLSWPVWLSAPLVRNDMEGVVRALVAVHPPLVINGILTGEPAWTEHSVAYHLSDLNQDVAIDLPRNCAACAALHGTFGLILLAIALVRRPVLQTTSSRLQ
jgi:hypothetical protein